ncbi:MAG: hypothetical protein ACYTFP_07010 [Planctomycetota bacterium]
MKTLRLGLIIAGCFLSLSGCQDPAQSSDDNWLLVSFEKDVPITYRMVSERETEIDLTTGDPKKNEKLELEMVYTPVVVDPFGLSTLKVECQSVSVTRSGFSGSDLERLAAELGKASFSTSRRNARIKNPDMIADFLAMQQYLWGVGSAIPNQLDLKKGDTWQTQQSIPWPVPIYPPPARTTTYILEGIEGQEDLSRRATIKSTYAMSETPIEDYIRPYEEGQFQMRGLFGFLRNFQFKHIEGTGTQVFNMDDGLVESDRQQYLLDVTASFMLPLGDSLPVLKVDQKISIERIETP